MNLEKVISELAEGFIDKDDLFLVSVAVSGSGKVKVLVLIDGDNGVGIDECAMLSRKIGNEIEERNLIKTAYALEVSSPGVGEPLQLPRQYEANVGRKLDLQLKDGGKWVGELLSIEGETLLINAEIKEKGKKKITLEEKQITLATIQKAKVKIVF